MPFTLSENSYILVSNKGDTILNNINKFKEATFLSATEMKTEFFKLNNTVWGDITNNDDLVQSSNITKILDFQKNLIEEVLSIHEMERKTPDSVASIIDSGIKTNELKGKLNGSYAYHDMYYLDDECDYYFIGDIHSDSYIISSILDKSQFFENILNKENFKLIFLGDYVDRGKNHLKTVQTLLLLKCLFPNHIYLLMGNHDIGHIEKGEVTLYLKKAEEDMDYFYIYLNHLHQTKAEFTDELLELYLKVMNTLNVSAFIITEKATIKGVHGGIPRPDENDQFQYLTHYKQLTDDSIDHKEFRIRDCILWSDPSIQENQPAIDKKRFKFYENQLQNYLTHFGLDAIVRGHQAIEDGCLELFDQKIYTIFSSGQIMEDDNNINIETAYDFVTPKILHYNHKKGLPMVQLPLN